MKSLLASLAAASLLSSSSSAGGGTPGTGGIVPVLTHSEPVVGHSLVIRIDNALPGALVGFAVSPKAGSFAIHQGTVYLDPAGLVIVATGQADAAGSTQLIRFIPPLVELAERELHFQAYVIDPAATAGAALSNSLHLRLLGSRLYIGVEGPPPGDNTGLLVRSAVLDEDMFLVDAEGTGPPVFNGNRAFGALPAGDEIRIFDNFFGRLVHAIPAPGVSQLVTDSSTTFYAFLASGELRHLDFETGATLGSLTDLGTGGGFAASPEGLEGYVTFEPPGMRRIDLGTMTELTPVPIGVGGDTDVGLPRPSTGGKVAVVSSQPAGPGAGADYTLTRVSTRPFTEVSTIPLGFFEPPTHDLAATAADVYLRWQLPYCVPPGPAFALVHAPLTYAGAAVPYPGPSLPPGAGCLQMSAGVEAAPYAWMIDPCCQEPPGGHEPAVLWRLTFAPWIWSGGVPLHDGQDRVAVVEDAFGSRVFVPKLGDFPPVAPATLYAVDTASLSSVELPYALVVPGRVGATFHAEVIP